MKLGPVNHILDNCSQMCENDEVENFLDKKGIKREVYFHKLEGNETSRVLNDLEDLEQELPKDKLQHVNCLKSLKVLQDAVCKTELDENYKVKISNFKDEYNKLREETEISITLKIHYIYDHLEDLLDMTGHGLNTVDDNTVECMHQHLNKRMQNSHYYVKDLNSELHGEKKLNLLLHVNGYNI